MTGCNRKRVTRWCGSLLWASAALGMGPGAARGQPQDLYSLPDLKALERTFTDLAERVRPSVVAIRTYRQMGPSGPESDVLARVTNSHGSGVVLRADGMILTNDHVLQDADIIKVVFHGGIEHEARLVQRDLRSDMAVIKVDGATVQPAGVGNASELRVGQWCFAVGNPFGLGYDAGHPAFTHGVISGLGRNLTPHLDGSDARYYGDLIQTSSAINPGNSGGPLFDIDGRMIGLVTAIVSRSGVTEGMGFAIPMDVRTRRIIDALMAGQVVRYGYLGVEVRPIRAAGGLVGALISRVSDEQGPAALANLRPEDVIVEFDGVAIRNSDHLVRIVGATPVGSSAQVRYLRAGQPQLTTVTVAERPGPPVARSGGIPETEIRVLQWRGAVLAEMDDEALDMHRRSRADAGVVVVSVEPISETRSAGLKPGDIILRHNGERVRTLAEFVEADRKEARAVKLELTGGRTVRMRR